MQGEVNDLGGASNLVEVHMSNTQTCFEDVKPSGPQVVWNNIAKEEDNLVKEHNLPSPVERPRRKVRIDIVP